MLVVPLADGRMLPRCVGYPVIHSIGYYPDNEHLKHSKVTTGPAACVPFLHAPPRSRRVFRAIA